ncbi:MAG: hypothetical protein OIF57_09605 [Marinobacterium sp.]|nr:hypothetical protein [Marinobacterium sp.]
MIPALAIECFNCQDILGPVHVYEHDKIRYLTFGDGGEQSAVDLQQPHVPVYDYTRAMLLALLLCPTPEHITLLGLGGGSLASSLLHLRPQASIQAIELRQCVADTAHQWFALPQATNLDVIIQPAETYLATTTRRCDLLFVDIYLDKGMQPAQLETSFLQTCAQVLTDNGILVLNLWDEGYGSHPQAVECLSQHFQADFLACSTESGNLVMFASKHGLQLPALRQALRQIRSLSRQLNNLPLQSLFERLHPLAGWA